MPNTTLAAPQVAEAPAKGGEGKAVPVVPFVRASDENLQPGNLDVSRLLLAGTAQDLGITDITSYGYIRYLYLLVEATGGAGAAVTAAEDGPFNVLQNVALTEPNGAYIVQFTSGYEMYLAHKYGGYFPAAAADPKKSPVFSAVAAGTGNFTFVLIVPVAVSVRDGVGALANQDSAGQFKFRATYNIGTAVYGTAPGTYPTVRTRAWLAAYDQPEVSSGGLVNETEPPGAGTTSFWSVQSGITVNAGENSIDLKRKGNYIRQIIFILRRAGTSRVNGEADWPSAGETRFLRDAFPARYYNNSVWRHIMYERTGFTGTQDTAGALDNGVRFHDYMHEFDGELGHELRDLWQASRGSTSLVLAGNFANAGTLTVIYNDVAIVEGVFV